MPAGRPKGSGKYGEETMVVRLPKSALTEFYAWLEKWTKKNGRKN